MNEKFKLMIQVYPTEILLKMDLDEVERLKDRVSEYDSRLWHVTKTMREIKAEREIYEGTGK